MINKKISIRLRRSELWYKNEYKGAYNKNAYKSKHKKEDRTSFAVARLRIHRTHDSVTYSEYKTIRITKKIET